MAHGILHEMRCGYGVTVDDWLVFGAIAQCTRIDANFRHGAPKIT